MTKFYIVKPEEGIRFGTKWAYADMVEPIRTGDSQHCPICNSAVSSLKWLPPHRIRLSTAKPEKWGDFVWGAGFPLLVSANFKRIYEQEGLTGIQEFSEPVEIVRMGARKSGVFPTTPPEYHLINVLWGGANQDDKASGLTHEHPEIIKCNFCRTGVTWRKQDQIVLEENSWDGSDIFKARNAPTSFMVSERFKIMVEKYELKNVRLIPADKFGYDERRTGLWFVHD